MEQLNEADYFKVLEEKVGVLLKKITSLKEEKESLIEKIRQQEGVIKDLADKVDDLKVKKDSAKDRISSILEKIEQMDI